MRLVSLCATAIVLTAAAGGSVAQSRAGADGARGRPEGPCDVYAAGGAPCVAAHSTTRALYAAYDGPLYRVMRQSDGRSQDIGVARATADDAGGYADAAAQDAFCANTYCWMTALYDQSGMGNDLIQAPRGGFSGPSMGGFNNVPIADMAPVTVMGHKVYGVFIEPGMGLRLDDPKGTAVDDQAEGQYWVVNGHHFNSGCCFDYGNGETDSRDDGDGTMETTYYGNATSWYRGPDPGPWIMTDQENNLVGCVNESPNDKYCADLPIIGWRFVTAMADGEPHHWRSMGGDAQGGGLAIMFDGPRVSNDRSSYDPMRKQGAIILGNGGDNSNGSQGTFYEGAMTAAGTFPSAEVNQRVQANVVAARYGLARLSLAPAASTDASPGLLTFSPGSARNLTLTFGNSTGAPATGLDLSVSVPRGWTAVALGTAEPHQAFEGVIAPGASVSATFTITSGPAPFNGDLVGTGTWAGSGSDRARSEATRIKVRSVSPIRINEFAVGSGSPDNAGNAFIELYNAGDSAVDISNWTLTQHATQQAVFSSVQIPAGTRLAARDFYVLGLANSGLAVPAARGDTTLYVRSTDGMAVGDTLEIGTGDRRETRRIAAVGTAAGPGLPASGFGGGRGGGPGGPTTLWQPLPDGPVITIDAGSNAVPVTSVAGFEVGQKMAIGYGATYPAVAQSVERYEVVTVTEVGKPGTQAWLSADASAGDTNIKVSSVENISVGDRIRLDIDSTGHGVETVTVTAVGTASARSTFGGPLTADDDPGTGLDLAEPLRFDHAANLPFSVRGTGIRFAPATAYEHSSNEPVLPLGTGVTLDRPLAADHGIDAVVRDAAVATAGYQDTRAPDQWFGGPALSAGGGSMVLRDSGGRVVDSLNYGGLVDPWAAEGYQARSGAGASGCSAPAPGGGPARGFAGFGAAAASPNRSAGRFPDGRDSDSNCDDFALQSVTSLAAPAAAGATNVKVASVADFGIGQTILIDTGASRESAVVAAVGTPGATTTAAAVAAGATVIPVASLAGFGEGQTVAVGSGADREPATIVAVTGRRRFGAQGPTSITVAEPLAREHGAGAELAGTGITLRAPLALAHASGSQVADHAPTPGAPNRYTRP
jgi:hypothetical protein